MTDETSVTGSELMSKLKGMDKSDLMRSFIVLTTLMRKASRHLRPS